MYIYIYKGIVTYDNFIIDSIQSKNLLVIS